MHVSRTVRTDVVLWFCELAVLQMRPCWLSGLCRGYVLIWPSRGCVQHPLRCAQCTDIYPLSRSASVHLVNKGLVTSSDMVRCEQQGRPSLQRPNSRDPELAPRGCGRPTKLMMLACLFQSPKSRPRADSPTASVLCAWERAGQAQPPAAERVDPHIWRCTPEQVMR